MAAGNGTGTSVAFGTSSFAANVTGIAIDGVERPAIPTSHLGTTTSATFIPGDIVDEGTVTLDIQYDPDVEPPKKGAAETVTITFPLLGGGSTAASRAFSAFVTSFDAGVEIDGLINGSVTVKVSGNVTVTAES